MEKLKRWNRNLNIIIGSFIGIFIGNSLYKYYDYKKHPSLYEIQSAPWYTSIQIDALVIGTVILIMLIFKILIKKKLNGEG